MRPNDVLELIQSRYHHEHGAVPDLGYPQFRGYAVAGRVGAGLGYRRADSGPLFLEAYLDDPIETVIADRLGQNFNRNDIIEIGNMAADNAPAMIALWAQAANDLGGEAEMAVAVLTSPLRGMFRRLGIHLHELSAAQPERLGADAARWGNYYALDPIICTSPIAEGQARLARFSRRLVERCA